jgi:hypothetical protein
MVVRNSTYAFCRSRMFIAVFTKSHYWTVFPAIQFYMYFSFPYVFMCATSPTNPHYLISLGCHAKIRPVHYNGGSWSIFKFRSFPPDYTALHPRRHTLHIHLRENHRSDRAVFRSFSNPFMCLLSSSVRHSVLM